MSDTNIQSLQKQLDTDLRQAMRDRDNVAKLTLRAVKTAVTEMSKAEGNQTLNDEEILAVVQKEAKRRRDAAAEYTRLGEDGRAAQEQAELLILERYLPKQVSEEEIEKIAQAVIAETEATSMRDMGRVMSAMMARIAGKADGKAVNLVVRRLLTE